MKRIIKKVVAVQGVLYFLISANAQGNALQRSVSVSVKNQKIASVLAIIENQANVSFSYSSKQIDVTRKIDLNVKNYSVAKVLEKIFGKAVVFSASGNYISLKALESSEGITISGNITNVADGLGIYQASLYEKQTLHSTISDKLGNFKLYIKKKLFQLQIKISKQNFKDTFIQILNPGKTVKLQIALVSTAMVFSALPKLPKQDTLTALPKSVVEYNPADNTATPERLTVNYPLQVSNPTVNDTTSINLFHLAKTKMNTAMDKLQVTADSISIKTKSNLEEMRWFKARVDSSKSDSRSLWNRHQHKALYNDTGKQKLKQEIGIIGRQLDSTFEALFKKIRFTKSDSQKVVNSLKKAEVEFKRSIDSIVEILHLDANKKQIKNDSQFHKTGDKFLSKWQRIHEQNVHDTFSRWIQIGFFPPLSTNGFLSGHITNNFSLNMIGGYSGGLYGFESAGIFNVTRRNVYGFQSAGIFNITGGNTFGFQAAGIFNQNFGKTQGFQAAGISNVVLDEMDGFQGAGILNACKSFTGCQMAGIVNIAGNRSNGAQFAGIANLATGRNHVTQLAGIVNVANVTTGAQISGIVNVADTVYGVQLGLVNISRSNYGIPIGLFNFSLNGYHQLALTYNTRNFAELSLRTGVRKFYSIWHVGVRSQNFASNLLLNYGFGIGHAAKINEKLHLNIDLEDSYIQPVSTAYFAFNQWFRLNLTANYFINKNLSIATGPVWNGFLSDNTHLGYGYISDIIPNRAKKIESLSFDTKEFHRWYGWMFSVRIL